MAGLGAGMAVLEQGGNAFDAAVAGFVLHVAEPHLYGPAGEVPILAAPAGQGGLAVVNGQGPAPAGPRSSGYRDQGLDLIPVPGCWPRGARGLPSLDALLRDHGTLRPRDVLEPAIAYAEAGFPAVPRIGDRHPGLRRGPCQGLLHRAGRVQRGP